MREGVEPLGLCTCGVRLGVDEVLPSPVNHLFLVLDGVCPLPVLVVVRGGPRLQTDHHAEQMKPKAKIAING